MRNAVAMYIGIAFVMGLTATVLVQNVDALDGPPPTRTPLPQAVRLNIGGYTLRTLQPPAQPYRCAAEWRFAISRAGATYNEMPASIDVTFARFDRQTGLTLPLTKGANMGSQWVLYVGAVALDASVDYATAMLPDTWYGQFVLAGGPCDGFGQAPSWETMRGLERAK